MAENLRIPQLPTQSDPLVDLDLFPMYDASADLTTHITRLFLESQVAPIGRSTQDTVANTLTLTQDAVNPLHAVTKQQLDLAIQGVNRKVPVRVETTANIVLSGEQTINSVAVVNGDSVLVKDQTDQTQNGIYVASTGAWARRNDADSSTELNHAIVAIQTSNLTYEQTTDNPNIGVDNIVWILAYSVGSTITDGEGLEISGNILSLELDGNTLSKTATGLKAEPDNINYWTQTGTDLSYEDKVIFSPLLSGSAANPSIAFGDGDSGFYELADDTLRISIEGIETWAFSSINLGSVRNTGPTMMHESAEINNPTIIPNRADQATGLGYSTTPIGLSLVTSGLEVLRTLTIASAVNRIEIENNITGSNPVIRSAGTDTNVGLTLDTQGTGLLTLGMLSGAGTRVVSVSSSGVASATVEIADLARTDVAETFESTVTVQGDMTVGDATTPISGITILNDAETARVRLIETGHLELYNESNADVVIGTNNAERIRFSNAKATLANGVSISFNDNLEIEHTGSISRISGESGQFNIRNNDATGADVLIQTKNNLGVIHNVLHADSVDANTRAVLYYNSNGKFVTTPTGVATTGQMDLSALNTAPSSPTDTGTLGEIRFTENAIYLCTAVNTWKNVEFGASANNLLNNADNTFSPTNYKLVTADTSDGVDSKAVYIGGGGDVVSNRGAYIGLHGNEHGSLPGRLTLGPGSEGFVEVQGDILNSGQYNLLTLNTAPSSPTDTGTLGEVRWTSTHVYLCTAANIWVRAALSTWVI